MLRWCFFIALYIELYESGLRLGDVRDLYGWGCGEEPVGCIFIARTGDEGESPGRGTAA